MTIETDSVMGEDNRICGKRERRIPRFLADFLIDEKLTKNTHPKALKKNTKTHRRLQSRPLLLNTRNSGLSTFCMRATLTKTVRIEDVNSGYKEYDSEETATASEGSELSEPLYVRGCATDCCPDQVNATESYFDKEFYYTDHDVQAQVALPTLTHRDMCRPPYEDPDYQRQLVASYSPDQGSETESDFEKEFYYTDHDVRAQVALPTLSHKDMCRPPYEDPDYQRRFVASYRRELLSTEYNKNARPLSTAVSHSWSNSHSPKHQSERSLREKRRALGHKKCRKVYGRDQRELWCTQCKWKKACTRFEDDDDI